LEQPSPLSVLLSSQASEAAFCPLPQRACVTDEVTEELVEVELDELWQSARQYDGL
jgi:hypothetical protein